MRATRYRRAFPSNHPVSALTAVGVKRPSSAACNDRADVSQDFTLSEQLHFHRSDRVCRLVSHDSGIYERRIPLAGGTASIFLSMSQIVCKSTNLCLETYSILSFGYMVHCVCVREAVIPAREPLFAFFSMVESP